MAISVLYASIVLLVRSVATGVALPFASLDDLPSLRHHFGNQNHDCENDDRKKHEEVSDRLIPVQDVECAEHPVPVVPNVPTPHERQYLTPRILGVHADVEETVAQQEQRELYAGAIVAFQESEYEQQGNDQLQERASRHPNEFPEECKHHMTGFVDGQLECVEDRVVPPRPERVDGGQAQDQRPYPELKFSFRLQLSAIMRH